MDLLTKIQFLSSLEAAVAEGQKSSNVDITLMLVNCRRCNELITQLRQGETDYVRQVL